MRPGIRKAIVLLSAWTVVATIWATPAEARRSSCAFCNPVCPGGEILYIMCWQKCKEHSTSATCEDPYGVCGASETFVHCSGNID